MCDISLNSWGSPDITSECVKNWVNKPWTYSADLVDDLSFFDKWVRNSLCRSSPTGPTGPTDEWKQSMHGVHSVIECRPEGTDENGEIVCRSGPGMAGFRFLDGLAKNKNGGI